MKISKMVREASSVEMALKATLARYLKAHSDWNLLNPTKLIRYRRKSFNNPDQVEITLGYDPTTLRHVKEVMRLLELSANNAGANQIEVTHDSKSYKLVAVISPTAKPNFPWA